jgi:cell wall-associated NlpC family hydrolase
LNAPDAARAYLGVPFVHQGRTRFGLDCIGLLSLALRDAGLERYVDHPENRADYSRTPHMGLLEARMRRIFGPPVADMQPGDVVALRYAGPIRHVGIVGDHPHGLSLIHTDSHLGRVTEHRIDDRWAKRIALVFRPEVSA